MSQKSVRTIVMEGVVVGLLLIPLTYLTGKVFSPLLRKPLLPDVCQSWNQFYVMEINLFLAGFFFHIILEYLGVNKWYVDNYYRNEDFMGLSGIRESCEDIICSDCQSYANEKDFGGYTRCKKACFVERKEDIDACCAEQCGENQACLESCQPLVYGEYQGEGPILHNKIF